MLRLDFVDGTGGWGNCAPISYCCHIKIYLTQRRKGLAGGFYLGLQCRHSAAECAEARSHSLRIAGLLLLLGKS